MRDRNEAEQKLVDDQTKAQQRAALRQRLADMRAGAGGNSDEAICRFVQAVRIAFYPDVHIVYAVNIDVLTDYLFSRGVRAVGKGD